jgi:hypothetical protein
MRLVVSFGVAALATIAIAGADLVSGISTASAQGSVVCQYGTARFKRCCRDSYENNPNLGARARGRDIDACMSGRDRDREKSEEPERTERKKSEEPEKGERRTRPVREERRPAGDPGLRRVDCSADGCNGGCPSGAPTPDGDRDVRCAEGRERPAVLVCAKR